MKAAMVAVALIALMSCGPGVVAKPTATATIGGTKVSLPLGTYCWMSNGHGECADAADPDDLLRTGYLKPVLAEPGSHVSVSFDRNPEKVETELLWPTTTVPIPHAGSTFDLPVATGRYVFVATGTWAEGDVGFFLAVDVV